MDWNTLLAAFLGGGVGGVLGAGVTYLQLRTGRRAAREQRQWLDADVMADVLQLTPDLDPARRGFNMSPAAEVERERSEAVGKRGQQVERELLRLATGHPSAAVRAAARQLASSLVRTAFATEWHVRDMQAQRDPQPGLGRAQEAHAEATAAARELERAVNAAAKS